MPEIKISDLAGLINAAKRIYKYCDTSTGEKFMLRLARSSKPDVTELCRAIDEVFLISKYLENSVIKLEELEPITRIEALEVAIRNLGDNKEALAAKCILKKWMETINDVR